MKILAPHKEQDGWKYVRVRGTMVPGEQPVKVLLSPRGWGVPQTPNWRIGYDDGIPGSRIISSRRVEKAVEQDDWLKRCANEGLTATYFPLTGFLGVNDKAHWHVSKPGVGYGQGPTLKEAYQSYRQRCKG